MERSRPARTPGTWERTASSIHRASAGATERRRSVISGRPNASSTRSGEPLRASMPPSMSGQRCRGSGCQGTFSLPSRSCARSRGGRGPTATTAAAPVSRRASSSSLTTAASCSSPARTVRIWASRRGVICSGRSPTCSTSRVPVGTTTARCSRSPPGSCTMTSGSPLEVRHWDTVCAWVDTTARDSTRVTRQRRMAV